MKQVLRTMLDPSILQSISSGLSVRRMLRTFVPCLMTIDEPRTLRSLMTTAESPSLSTAPLASLATSVSSSLLLLSEGRNSCAQSGHT